MRGTLVTMLRRAGCNLNESAVCMGWSIRHAANMIERYAKIVPEVTDQIGTKFADFKRATAAFVHDRQQGANF